NNSLSESNLGILCLTPENKESRWIHYEAGALAKGLSSSRVYTLLIGLSPADLQPPLSQFNATPPDKEKLKKLIISLNEKLGERALDDSRLARSFETQWARFEKEFEIAARPEAHLPAIPQ